MEMTIEQKRALALASARKRMAEAQNKPEQAQPTQEDQPAQQADMSLMGRIKDNVIGVDDGVMSTGEKVATALNVGGESMTLGVVGDEAAAAADSLIGRGNYDERLQKYRGDEAQFRTENPKTAFAAEVAPAFIPGMGTMSAMGKAKTIGGAMLRGAGIGAASGATYGFMEGEGGLNERAEASAKGFGLGILFGGAASGTFAALSKAPRGVQHLFRKADERPTIETLRTAKNAAYHAVDQSGEVFSADDTTRLYQRVKEAFDGSNYVEDVDNASRASLRILERNAGEELTLGKLDKVRQGLWARYNSAPDQPHILDAIKAVDDLIEEKAGASEAMAVARAANARFAKSQLLEDAFTKASDQVASTGSGGNVLNKYRQAVTSIINNPKKARFFSDDEIGLMREFVRGSFDENAKRLVGKMSPSGNGLMLTLHTIAGVSTGGATVPLMAIGHVAKNSADRSAMRGANAIQDYLAGVERQAAQPVRIAPAATATAPLASDAGNLLGNTPRNYLGTLQPR